MPNATAVFKAVAEFGSLNREVDKTYAKLAALKKEASDPASSKAFEANLSKMSTAQSKLRGETDKLTTAFGRAERAATSSADKHTTALKQEQDAASSKIGTLQRLAQHLQGIAQAEKDATNAAKDHTASLKSESNALSKSEAAHRSHADALRDTARSSEDSSRSNDKLNDSLRRTGSSSSQSKGFISSLSSELKNFNRTTNDSNLSVSGFGRTLLLMIAPAVPAFIGGLVGSIVALGGALIGIIGAAGPAAGALAALGPAALAVGGAVGTAMLAFKGIGAALKALTASQVQSANTSQASMSQAASAARGLANAEDALRAAQRARANAQIESDRQVEAADKALARAHNDVRLALADLNAEREQAVRDLIDMRNAEVDATLSVEAADIALIDAKEEQAKVNADATSTALDRRKAALRVAEAEQRLKEANISSSRATEDNNKAQAAGVNGASNVVAATQRVVDAKTAESEAVTGAAEARRQASERMISADESVVHAQRALEAAMEAVSQAVDKQSAAQTKLADLMSHLSPAGQAFVFFLKSLVPLLDKLSGAAQTSFLPGLQTAIQTLIPMIDSVAIPSIKAFGAVLSSLAIDGAKEIKSFERDFLSFGTGAGPKLVDSFGHILLNLLNVILNLSMAAIPLLEWLTKLTLAWSEHLKMTTQVKRDTGELASFFDKVKAVLTVLGNILKNVGGILHQVFAAAAPMGMRLLQSFEALTKKTNDYFHSTEGFNKLKKYFDDMEPSIRIILQLFGMLAKAILATGASKTTYELLVTIRDVLVPAFKRLSEAMREVSLSIGKQLIEILAKLADALTNLINAGGGGGLSAFVSVLNAVASVFRAITAVPFLAELGVWLLAIAGGLKAIKLVGSITGLSKVAGGLNALGGRAASYRAGDAAPVKESPTTFLGGARAAVAGETATPRTLTARAGSVAGSAVARAAGVGAGAAPSVQTAIPAASAPVYPPGTARSAPLPPSRTAAVAGAVGRGVRAVAPVAVGIAGSVGGGLAGGAIGQAVGGDMGGVIGGIAGSVAGAYAPDVIAAGLAKVKPLAEGVKSALAGVASTLSGAVASAAGSAAGGLGKAVGAAASVAGAVASAAGSYIKLGVEALAANAKQLIFSAGSLIVRGAVAAWAAVQWVLNAALTANPIGIVIVVLAALVAAFIYAWTHSEKFREIVMGVLGAVGDFFKMIWESVLKPVFDEFMLGVHQLGDAFNWALDLIKFVWNNIGAILYGVYSVTVKPIFDGFMAVIRSLVDAFNWALGAIKFVWDNLGAILYGVYGVTIKPIFDAFMGIVHAIADSFGWAIGVIQTAWNRLGDIAKIPVNFVINTVYNAGIVPLWNAIADTFGLGKLAPARPLAEGGVLPGYSPGVDSVPAVLSPGEGILVPEAVRGLGPDFVYKANEYFSGGRARPARGSGGANRFAEGGVVGSVASALGTMITDPVGSVKRLFSSVLGDAGRTPGSGKWTDVLKSAPVKIVDAIVEKAKEYARKAQEAAAAAANVGAGGLLQGGGPGVEKWRATGLAALTAENQALENIGRLLMQMNTESGGNPTIVNQWDSNWQAGHPSVGLMQVIAGTYARYKDPRLDKGPYSYGVSVDPLANITASIRYTQAAYGSLAAGWQGHGYSRGGPVGRVGGSGGGTGRGSDSVPAWLTPGEFVLNKRAVEAIGSNNLDLLNRFHAADLFSPVGVGSVPGAGLGAAVRAGIEAVVSGRSTTNNVHGDSNSKAITVNTNIFNPVAEPASDSAAARMRTLGLLGMFS